MKYIFCIIAILLQPIFILYGCHGEDKRLRALKMSMISLSVAYLVIQFYVFFKVCTKIYIFHRESFYAVQGAMLAVFFILEGIFFCMNQYIIRVQKREASCIVEYKAIIKRLEILMEQTDDFQNKECIQELYEKMKYEDPVSSEKVANENKKINELIAQLSEIEENALFAQKCKEIEKEVKVRNKKNLKEQG